MAVLRTSGAHIQELEVVDPDLEEVFVNIMSKREQQPTVLEPASVQ